MLKLGGGNVEVYFVPLRPGTTIYRVTDRVDRIPPLRRKEAFLARGDELPKGFAVYLALRSNAGVLQSLSDETKTAVLPNDYNYLADGDVIRIRAEKGAVRVLYRRNSAHNSFLLTERCNHYCLMCSQPPKDIDDAWIVDDILAAIPLIDTATAEIGFTGGEPTLLGDDLIRILMTAKNYLPTTSIHILSNGRRFADFEFTKKYADVGHQDMMVGIPLYSDLSTIHDYVVQADSAYDETIRGILNLKRLQQKVELRVVIHQQTFKRLPQLAEFIARNLTFVDHVALMRLEITGFTRGNLDKLWIDPTDYMPQLLRATRHLADHHIHVSIYNHQLCLLDRRLWPFARKSISDWKNEYMPECDPCIKKDQCGGFFSSARLRYSDHINPFH